MKGAGGGRMGEAKLPYAILTSRILQGRRIAGASPMLRS